MNENGIFQLGSFKVKPGERVSGFLSLGEGEFQLPVTILNGEEPGKTVLITAGIHAEEYVGIQAAVELADRLKDGEDRRNSGDRESNKQRSL